MNHDLRLPPILLLLSFAPAPSGGAQESRPQGSESRPVATPMPIPTGIMKHRGERTIRVDGSLADWPELPFLDLGDLRQVSGSQLGAWRGRSDLAAHAFLLWDEEDVWFAANVQDDWRRPLPAELPEELGFFDLPAGDGVVLTFDPRRDTRAFGDDPGRVEDAEFWIGRDEKERNQLIVWNRFRGEAKRSSGAAWVSYDQERKLYVYEARIPWSEILPPGKKPEDGMAIDVQIVVNDFDAPTDPLPQTRVGWTFGVGITLDPGIMGTLVLTRKDLKSGDPLPAIPPHPGPVAHPVPPPSFWIKWLRELGSRPPVVVAPGDDPEQKLGAERLERLVFADAELARFPRCDFFEMTARVQRRMQRELGGMLATGFPCLFDLIGERLARELQSPPTRGVEITRLAPGGWLVRSAEGSFAIDPQGPRTELLERTVDFVFFTDSSDLTRTHAPLVQRLFARGNRKVLGHLAWHVPGIDPREMPIMTPGDRLTIGTLEVEVLGSRSEDGKVTMTAGVRVKWPDGRVLVHPALSLLEESLGPAPRIDWFILPARAPNARALVTRLAPKLVLIEDALDVHRAPATSDFARKPLHAIFELQKALPSPSVVLFWGEKLGGL